MAWDKDRPYAPFVQAHTDWRGFDVRPHMESYAFTTPNEADIDRMYETGELVINNEHFRPFNDVELSLTFVRYSRGRSATVFWWVDTDGRRYPMFATEFNRLLDERLLAQVISGTWSAEKRGANYGIRLVE